MLIVVVAGLALSAANGRPPILVEAGASTSLGRSLCGVSGDLRVKLDGGQLVVPTEAVHASVKITSGDCAAPESQTVRFVPALQHGAVTAWIFPDDGRLELHGGGLTHAVVWWRVVGGAWKSESCGEMIPGADGKPACALSIPPEDARAMLAVSTGDVILLPAGSPAAAGSEVPELWTRGGKAPATLEALRVAVQRFVLTGSIVHATSIEAWREQSVLPLAIPKILASVSCRPASCWLSDDGAAIIVDPPATGDAVTVNARLSERVWLRQEEGFASGVTFSLPLARCQLRPLVGLVLGGTEDHRLPVALGDRCPSDLSGLAVETTPPSGAYLEGLADDGKRIDVRLGHIPSRVTSLELRLLRGATHVIVGSVRVDVRSSYAPIQVSLTDAQIGDISVIPTNREVRVQWATPDTKVGPAIVPVPLRGYYSLRHQGGDTFIRGETKTSGAMPLRFAFLASEGESGEPLVTFDSEVHFPVRPVNVPVSLAPDHARTGGLFSVVCRDDVLGERQVPPGDLVSLPYAARGSCRLRIDPTVLTPADGAQRIRVTVTISSPTGTSRSGGFSQVLVLSSGTEVDTLWLGSNEALRPFDHMVVSIAHDDQPGHYLIEGAAAGRPARRYQMVFGDARLRIYGSAAVPTGLYRIARGSGSGILQFSAGALVRLAFLDREGREYPFDFEFALLGTNLSGHADLSIVAGTGITVPLLNPQEAAQAAIGIHAWVEYAPTRKNTGGQPFAIIFGPSISFGDFGTNL